MPLQQNRDSLLFFYLTLHYLFPFCFLTMYPSFLSSFSLIKNSPNSLFSSPRSYPLQNFDMDDFNDDEGGINDANSNYCATPPRSMLPLSHSPSPSSSSLTPLPRPLPLSRPQLSLTPRLSVSNKHYVRVLYIRLNGM